MSLNLHPIFVHFPIAFLTIYSLLELVRFKKLLNLKSFLYTKITVLFIGVFSAIPTGFSGKLIEKDFPASRNIIEVHSRFAVLATFLYGLILLVYLSSLIGQTKIKLPSFILKTSEIVLSSFIIVPLALLSLILITITGALGGIIAFGAQIDPFTQFVYNLFFK